MCRVTFLQRRGVNVKRREFNLTISENRVHRLLASGLLFLLVLRLRLDIRFVTRVEDIRNIESR